MIAASWKNLKFTNDPIASSLQKDAKDANERRPARRDRPQGHLRPDAPQQGAEGRRASRRSASCDGQQRSSGRTRRAPAEPAPADGARRVAVSTSVSKVFGHGPATRCPRSTASPSTCGAGEFVCLLGASGCGKSTLLNLSPASTRRPAGTVEVDGRTALMFQEAALFPWLTVRGNVELAAEAARASRSASARAGRRAARRSCTSSEFGGKRPHELSGGMRQRVALARALAQDADVLLMDEPFGALDAMTRDLLHDELERLWHERTLTVLFVTHNVREAARLGDRVVLLSSRPGRVAAEFAVDIDRPRRIDSPEVAGARRPHHRRSSARRCAAMADDS